VELDTCLSSGCYSLEAEKLEELDGSEFRSYKMEEGTCLSCSFRKRELLVADTC
jgi:hypothetical protein